MKSLVAKKFRVLYATDTLIQAYVIEFILIIIFSSLQKQDARKFFSNSIRFRSTGRWNKGDFNKTPRDTIRDFLFSFSFRAHSFNLGVLWCGFPQIHSCTSLYVVVKFWCDQSQDVGERRVLILID